MPVLASLSSRSRAAAAGLDGTASAGVMGTSRSALEGGTATRLSGGETAARLSSRPEEAMRQGSLGFGFSAGVHSLRWWPDSCT